MKPIYLDYNATTPLPRSTRSPAAGEVHVITSAVTGR